MTHPRLEEALILHARPWRETSLLLEVFTREHGRLGLLARGVRGARRSGQRALLQPLQPLQLAWRGRGELPLLGACESGGVALGLRGDALLAAFYVNELLLRLLPRGDAHAALFGRYVTCLEQLRDDSDVAWVLRRFERDLLGELGYALDLQHDHSGRPIDADAWYRFDPEQGATPAIAEGRGVYSGAALRALGEERIPDAALERQARALLRRLIAHQLQGRELHSLALVAQLHRKSPAPRGARD